MSDLLRRTLSEALADRQFLQSEFYQRWEAGGLEMRELSAYAAQYRHFEGLVPELLREVAAGLDAGAARELVLQNLADEVGPPAHLDLFNDFAGALGAADDAAPSPAMQRLLDTYRELYAAGPVQGLAALTAYETQAAAVAATKAEGLRSRYGLDETSVTFWSLHAEIDKEHGDWAVGALSELDPTGEVTGAAARRAADAWWDFLDEREREGQLTAAVHA